MFAPLCVWFYGECSMIRCLDHWGDDPCYEKRWIQNDIGSDWMQIRLWEEINWQMTWFNTMIKSLVIILKLILSDAVVKVLLLENDSGDDSIIILEMN